MRRAARSRAPWAHRAERERGAAAVEFALVFCFVLVPLMMGMLEFGWYLYTSQVSASAARDTARRLAVGDCAATTDAAQTFARNQSGIETLELAYGAPTDVMPSSSSMPAVGSTVRVWVTVDVALFEYLPLPSDGVVTHRIDARVEDDTLGSTCP